MDRKPKASAKLDKSPYNRRGEKITDKAFKSVDKSVKPVAKDTNKTISNHHTRQYLFYHIYSTLIYSTLLYSITSIHSTTTEDYKQ